MGEQAWKSDERRVADLFGGIRRPQANQTGRSTAPDVVTPRFAIEVKRRARRLVLIDKALEKAEHQAELARLSGLKVYPLAVIHYTGSHVTSGLVIVRVRAFLELCKVPISEPNDDPDVMRLLLEGH
jgi:hypothetical protein